MTSPARRRSARCPGSTISTDQPNSASAAAVAAPAMPPPATMTPKSPFGGTAARLETGQGPGREVGVVQPVIEHCRTEEHAINAIARPIAVHILAGDQPINAAPRRLGRFGLDLEQSEDRPGGADDQARWAGDVALGKTAGEMLAPPAILVLDRVQPTARSVERRILRREPGASERGH